ncbi:MAG: hypothetical protein HY904_03710 [Deltaproteobacteria bacterium]|nr:hypothetical protein [Deltaproteobacteria bacterium]
MPDTEEKAPAAEATAGDTTAAPPADTPFDPPGPRTIALAESDSVSTAAPAPAVAPPADTVLLLRRELDGLPPGPESAARRRSVFDASMQLRHLEVALDVVRADAELLRERGEALFETAWVAGRAPVCAALLAQPGWSCQRAHDDVARAWILAGDVEQLGQLVHKGGLSAALVEALRAALKGGWGLQMVKEQWWGSWLEERVVRLHAREVRLVVDSRAVRVAATRPPLLQRALERLLGWLGYDVTLSRRE